MYIEEEKKLDILVADIPVGGVFKPLSGKIYMKILPDKSSVIRGVCLTNGAICAFPVTAKAEYFENATMFLKH